MTVKAAEPAPLWFREPPSANRWWRNVNGRMVTSKEAREYKQHVANECLVRRVQKIAAPTPVRLRMIWHRSRKSGDLDKRLGVLLDALQGSLYDNDSQIIGIEAERWDTAKRGDFAHGKVVVFVSRHHWDRSIDPSKQKGDR